MAPGDVEAGDRVAERTQGARHCLQVREDGYCFACGSENPIGLKLDFRLIEGRTHVHSTRDWTNNTLTVVNLPHKLSDSAPT